MTAAHGDAGSWRVVFNRDESPHRPPASPPIVVNSPGGAAVMPIDTPSGGTWLAATAAGLVVAIINRTSARAAGRGERAAPVALSRGVIIPGLVQWMSVAEVLRAAGGLPMHQFNPFRLIVLTRNQWGHLVGDARRVRVWQGGWDGRPLLWTSSGLGDRLVHGPRRRLFRQWREQGPWSPQRQDAFHAHRWPDHPERSVLMDRGLARTVSVTSVTVTPHRVTMQYRARDADDASELTLPRARALSTQGVSSA